MAKGLFYVCAGPCSPQEAFLFQHRSAWLATVALGMLAVAPAHAQRDTALATPHKTIVFSPDRPARCDYFFVTEFNVAVTGVKSQDAVDRFLFTDALGVMRNFDRSRALGVSLDAHLTAGAVRFAPTVRFKQWLKGRSSLDLLLGYATASIEQEGVVGPIVDVRYSPTSWFHIQAGACRIRSVGSIYYYPTYYVNEKSQIELHAGLGLGGVPGAIAWGAQAIGLAGLALAVSGME